MSSAEEPLPPHPLSRVRADRRTRTLSREAIVTGALAVLDAEGIDALSMRRVAQELGTGPASLYAHVSGKDELLELVLDLVLGEVEVPDPDPARWQEQVKEMLRSMRRVMARHRGIASVNLGYIPSGVNALRTAEGMLAIMRAGGVSAAVAGLAVDLLSLYAVATSYEDDLWAARMDAHGSEEFSAQLQAFFGGLPADRFPNLVAMAADVTANEGEDHRFDFGLDVLLAGLAAMSGRR